jgi:single-strand DNA-binding protein
MSNFNYNETEMIGRLTRDPEVNYTAGGKAVTKFGVVTNRSWKGADDQWKEKATFSDWIMWNGSGEAFAKNARKGDQVFVKGEFGVDEWEDKNDGTKRSRPVFTALMARVLSKAGAGKSAEGSEDTTPTEPKAKRGRPAKSETKPAATPQAEDDDEDSDIPF